MATIQEDAEICEMEMGTRSDDIIEPDNNAQVVTSHQIDESEISDAQASTLHQNGESDNYEAAASTSDQNDDSDNYEAVASTSHQNDESDNSEPEALASTSEKHNESYSSDVQPSTSQQSGSADTPPPEYASASKLTGLPSGEKPNDYGELAAIVCIFNFVFGLIALKRTATSRDKFRDGDLEGSRKAGRCALCCSLLGILTAFLITVGLLYIFVYLPAVNKNNMPDLMSDTAEMMTTEMMT